MGFDESPQIVDVAEGETLAQMKDHKEQTISQVEPYKPMEKTEDDGVVVPKKIVEDEVTAADE